VVHVWSTSIGPERFTTVSSGISFAQVAVAILQKQALVQNPDKDEVAVLIGLALSGRPIRSLVAEDRSADGVSDRTGPDLSVRAGSVPQRSTTGIGGHQRSLTVQRNRRSPALQLRQLR
jgi:hypothetical protein